MLKFVVDTSVIQRYAAADGLTISPLLAHFADAQCTVVAPAVCVSEAHWTADEDEERMVHIFEGLPPVIVEPLVSQDAASVGGIARFMGGLGMTHACLIASSTNWTLLTAEPVLAGKFLRSDQIWEV